MDTPPQGTQEQVVETDSPKPATLLTEAGIPDQAELLKELYKEFWELMYATDFAREYYREVTATWTRRDRSIRIALAVFSSGAIASLGIWSVLGGVWGIIAGVNVVISVIHPLLKMDERIKDATGKYALYNKLYHSWYAGFRDLRITKDVAKALDRRERNYAALEGIEEHEIESQDPDITARVAHELDRRYEHWTG